MSECSGKERRKNIGAAIKQLQRCVIIKKKKRMHSCILWIPVVKARTNKKKCQESRFRVFEKNK